LTGFFHDRTKLRPFDNNVRKYRLLKTVMASFDTGMVQMAEMCQRKTRKKDSGGAQYCGFEEESAP